MGPWRAVLAQREADRSNGRGAGQGHIGWAGTQHGESSRSVSRTSQVRHSDEHTPGRSLTEPGSVYRCASQTQLS
eukprot:8594507-Alexandrium_andersonii.AAC.1